MSKINFGVAVVNSFDLLDDENADEQPKVTSKTSAKEDKGISRGKQAEPKKEITSPSQKGGESLDCPQFFSLIFFGIWKLD